MLGKNTVLFVGDDAFRGADAICAKLNADADFFGLVVSCDKLVSVAKLRLRRVRLELEARKNEILKRRRAGGTAGEKKRYFDILSRKKTENMFFRYSPIAVVTNDPDIRYSLAKCMAESGIGALMFAYCDSLGADRKLIDRSIEAYFVDNIGARELLLDAGAAAEKIEVNPLPVPRACFEPYDQELSKQSLGLDPKKKICALYLEESDDFYVPHNNCGDVSFHAERFARKPKRLRAESRRARDESDAAESAESERKRLELFRAADCVAMRYDPHFVREALAMRKPVIAIDDGSCADAERLRLANKICAIRKAPELLPAVKSIMDGSFAPEPDEADPSSAERIATRLKEAISHAKPRA